MPNEPNFGADVCIAQAEDIIDVPTKLGGFLGLDKLSNEAIFANEVNSWAKRRWVEVGRELMRRLSDYSHLLSFAIIFGRGWHQCLEGPAGMGEIK